ncbi:MAG: M48 family metalloprotease [Caulobacterales bacterium]
MTPFDPNVAAAAWLAALPATDRLAADHATDLRLWTWAAAGLLMIAVCALILRLGLLARLREMIERNGPRPWLAGAACAGVFALAVTGAKAPLDAFGAWRKNLILGNADAGLAADLAHAFAGVLPVVGAAVVFVPLAQWLARRRPRAWPAILGAALCAMILAVGWLPYALSAGPALAPLPAGPVREGVLHLIHGAGIPATEVYASADPDFDADVTGGFGRAQVVVGPRLAGASPAEARAFVGHVMGHYAHADVFTIFLVYGLLTIAALAAVPLLFAPAARLLGAGTLQGPADPQGLPVVLAILIAAAAIATPLSSAYIRWVNVRADAFSLDHAREPDGLAASLEREWDHQSVDPSPLERALFYTHPPLKSRLVHAMAWKAAHGG